ncbi:mannosyl-oligosaccharide alpha-1,2-mannosidase [Coemansia sp. RSA 1722]|nr:mannosyl-oligosaccharide alpha-1,2-mannosidase [Coemansia sp. RSA 486]KAJ2237655.1 mannosyl-oligosaccharide alpha-1,2-mannosidase [Coemansia sp. RSA 485]KAJ2600970.1 mannosyl-oligosaccharide alpha-1,2-mannosidase [Coemansia sp. RSA 1721]KAJ2605674.1 mannosyl-oligosaccharide alpha-1,2-mannosidase [Coemansia sp. RSA 1722]KAJ2638965.1 mannosyl-oligosaccharide alpha-1,2-mannosidase [Coemansia sp. RSA 1286]
MFNSFGGRFVGGPRKRLAFLAAAVLLLTGYTLYRQSSSSQPAIGQPTDGPAYWVQFADHVPSNEYQLLLDARSARTPAFSGLAASRWTANQQQQHELNQVIRAALTSAVEGTRDTTKLWKSRRQRVVEAARNAWQAYRRDALGSDEYHPVSHSGTNLTEQGIGYFIADVLDTLLLMGLKNEYQQGRDYLVQHLGFEQTGSVSLFETTIRVLGGLLSAFHWSGESDKELLRLANELGLRLLESFDYDSGIPRKHAVLGLELTEQTKAKQQSISVAEAGTLQLEFRYLAQLTGNAEFRRQVDRVTQFLSDASKRDGLAQLYLNATTKRLEGDILRMGGASDSYYEYLLKQWLQTGQTEPALRQQYDQAMDGMKKYLIDVSAREKHTFVGELKGLTNGKPRFVPKMEHLACFLAGNLALGATRGRALGEISPLTLSARDREDLVLARQLGDTCAHMYFDMPSGLSPEAVYLRSADRTTGTETSFNSTFRSAQPTGDVFVNERDAYYILRPETVESFLILWRITGERKWREYGWRVFEAIERWTKLRSGAYTSAHDVLKVPPPLEDKMHTFFVSETLKYFYLLFGDADAVPLTRYVFNTEAHPLPLLQKAS